MILRLITYRLFLGEVALEEMNEKSFAVILMDVNMPGISGYETASIISRDERISNTPIIMVTADHSQSN